MKRIVAFTILFAFGIVLLSACSGGSQGIGETGISLEEYNQLHLNMTYNKALEIIGGKGQEISESKSNEEEYIKYTHVYRFEGETGGYAELEFTIYSYYDKIDFNEYLTSKTQYNLE